MLKQIKKGEHTFSFSYRFIIKMRSQTVSLLPQSANSKLLDFTSKDVSHAKPKWSWHYARSFALISIRCISPGDGGYTLSRTACETGATLVDARL